MPLRKLRLVRLLRLLTTCERGGRLYLQQPADVLLWAVLLFLLANFRLYEAAL